jgi:hypothetical protein
MARISDLIITIKAERISDDIPVKPKPPIDRIIAHNRWPDGGYDTCPKCGSSRASGWVWSKKHRFCINEECSFNIIPIPKK